jgi:hypothetical protein
MGASLFMTGRAGSSHGFSVSNHRGAERRQSVQFGTPPQQDVMTIVVCTADASANGD